MRILFVADVFGAPGRRAVELRLPSLREELGIDFCIVNGENAAAGRGITAKIAERLIAETLAKQGVDRDSLTIHADRGSSQASKPVAFLLADLGVTKSHSRPHTSNDNPYSEAQFKTLKYRPEFPERFRSMEEARAFCREFFTWYNEAHRHSGIAFMTPEAVHYGRAEAVNEIRGSTLAAAFAAHPERFVRPPALPRVPTAVWINRPEERKEADQ